MLYLTAACGCNIGKVRVNNEDNFYFAQKFLPKNNSGLDGIRCYQTILEHQVCFGIFDGMGGESYGGEAAYLAAYTMHEELQAYTTLQDNLIRICIKANQRICQVARQRKVGIIGTTAVLLGIKETKAYLVNIGDSRAFLYHSGRFIQISVDHTDRFLFREPDKFKRKPRLTQHLGIEPTEMIIQPFKTEISIQTGDIFLLCSDGLTDMVCETEIKEIIDGETEVKDIVQMLIDKAMNYGGKDNITIIVCKINDF